MLLRRQGHWWPLGKISQPPMNLQLSMEADEQEMPSMMPSMVPSMILAISQINSTLVGPGAVIHQA